jgi:integrase/recombinase XerD
LNYEGILAEFSIRWLNQWGVHVAELVNLAIYDIDAERGTLMVRQGKDKKDRMILIGDRALAWLDKYLIEVRPTLAPAPDRAG